MMRISSLADYGVPQPFIDMWMDRQGNDLLPLQAGAVKHHGLLDCGSLVISAPTSSGKTFCGELAAAHTLAQGKKAIFAVPLKSLAEERYGEFLLKYGALGLRVAVSTRDHREHDYQIERGEFDLCIVIYEKLNQMLLKNLDLLKSVDLLVIDELQMLADEARGAVLELLLLKVLNSAYECRIIGLSAVMGNASELADWIGAGLLIESQRPVELRQGVLFDSTFYFRCFNSGENGTEEMAPLEKASPSKVLIENAARLVEAGEQVLIFLKSKRSCVRMARALAERSSFSLSESAVDELAVGERSLLSEILITVAKRAVAFHNADLTYEQRRAIEKQYVSGAIRAIFSTTTLSLGLNLPAQTAFLETFRYRQGKYTGQPLMEPLSWNDYENMCGRAGRLGFPSALGRSIVIAASELEKAMMWTYFVRGKPDVLCGNLFVREPPDLVLDLVVSRCVVTRDALLTVLKRAFSEAPEGMDAVIHDAVDRLIESELVSESAEKLVPTAYGEKLAHLGISVTTGLYLRSLFGSGADHPEIVLLYEFCDTFEGNRIHVSDNLSQDAELRLFARFQRLVRKTGPISERLAEMLDRPNRVERHSFSRARLALALRDWIRGKELMDIETRYGMYAGTLYAAGEMVSWLAEGAFSLMRIMGIGIRKRARLKKLSFEARHGLPAHARKLHIAVEGLLSRKESLLLYDNGIATVDQFVSSERRVVSDLIGTSKLEGIMRELLDRPSAGKSAEPDVGTGEGVIEDAVGSDGSRSTDSDGKPTLMFLGTMIGDRFRLLFRGRRLSLTAKSFTYLFKLAAGRKLDGDRWIDKEELEPGFNQARYIYNLKKELGGSLFNGLELIQNNRRGGYRLGLEPDEIHFDLAAMARLDDFEIVRLCDRLASL